MKKTFAITRESFIKVENIPRLHTVPLPSIRIETPKVVVHLDDESERRVQLEFKPYQGVRITTVDCFDSPSRSSLLSNTIVEVLNSSWIFELHHNLKHIDFTANFMKYSRHFLVPLGDDVLEVVAWNMEVMQIGTESCLEIPNDWKVTPL